MKLKIAIVVHGRFHSFDLANALIKRGHDVTLLTNYPKWVVKRFGFPLEKVRSYWLHAVLTRIVHKLDPKRRFINRDEWWHTLFGRWARRILDKENWDIVHLWSGVAEETLASHRNHIRLMTLMRGSAHIVTQARLLAEEAERVGIEQDQPSDWMIAREKREYQMVDAIVTLSSFAHNSFIDEGFAGEKIKLLPLGANLANFCPLPEVIEARCQRILSGQPLRVLFVGTLCYRKGLQDIASILTGFNALNCNKFEFRFIGPSLPEAANFISSHKGLAEFITKRPHHELPKWYSQGDIFIFPTIEDGFAVVLAQAAANGLPILTTTNCGGPDILREGETGWILPIRDPVAFIERLRWCDEHREALAAMVRNIYQNFKIRDWDDVAADFEAICLRHLEHHLEAR